MGVDGSMPLPEEPGPPDTVFNVAVPLRNITNDPQSTNNKLVTRNIMNNADFIHAQ